MVQDVREPRLTIKLPASLDEVEAVIGNPATLALIKSFGGTTVRLPAKRNISAANDIALVIGVDALSQLVAALGGARYVYLPRCAAGFREARDLEIIQRSKTESVDKLALQYGLCDRQIWTILKKPINDQQENLF